jgi:hypothetical protein
MINKNNPKLNITQKIIFKKEINEAQNPAEKWAEKEKEYLEKFANPYLAAERGYIDEVIYPSQTREKLIKAFEMLKTAESQILGLRNTPGRNVQAWSSWAESNVALMKSIYLMRTGKWDESFVQIKISVEKSKEVLPMLNLFENDKQKMHAKCGRR